jgi:glycosyltransferase involved in cell wall biosynthesis
MKLAYLTGAFPRFSEGFLLNEIVELERQGVEIEIFSLNKPGDPRFHPRLAELHAPVNYSPAPDSAEMWRLIQAATAKLHLDPFNVGDLVIEALCSGDNTALHPFLHSLWLASALSSRGIQHLHTHINSSTLEVALLASRLGGRSFSFTQPPLAEPPGGQYRSLLVQAIEQCSFGIAVTELNLQWLRKLTPGGSKISHISYGLPLDRMTASEELGFPIPSIVAAGKLIERKGFSYLIEACRLLSDSGRKFRCTIIGGGKQEGALRTLVESLGVGDCVTLAGAQPQTRVLDAIRRSAVTVVPSVASEEDSRDVFPEIVLESLALGRAIVATDIRGIGELIEHGREGLIVPQRNSLALAEALNRLLTEHDLRLRMHMAARAKAEMKFDLARNAGSLKKLLEKTCVRGTANPAAAAHTAA